MHNQCFYTGRQKCSGDKLPCLLTKDHTKQTQWTGTTQFVRKNDNNRKLDNKEIN